MSVLFAARARAFFYHRATTRDNSFYSDYKKEYERQRDLKLNAAAAETSEKLDKIKTQGPGDVVHLSGLVSELSCGRELADVYASSVAHNESSEDEGEEDDRAAEAVESQEENDFNDFVAKRRDAQQKQMGK